jgi:hypothetical protein
MRKAAKSPSPANDRPPGRGGDGAPSETGGCTRLRQESRIGESLHGAGWVHRCGADSLFGLVQDRRCVIVTDQHRTPFHGYLMAAPSLLPERGEGELAPLEATRLGPILHCVRLPHNSDSVPHRERDRAVQIGRACMLMRFDRRAAIQDGDVRLGRGKASACPKQHTAVVSHGVTFSPGAPRYLAPR